MHIFDLFILESGFSNGKHRLIFTLLSLDFYCAVLKSNSIDKSSFAVNLVGLCFSLSLGLLVKATTALPALALMSIHWVWKSSQDLRKGRGEKTHLGDQLSIALSMAIALGLLIAGPIMPIPLSN